MEEVLILIKNELSHKEYNSRLIEYVNDRHSYINNNGFRLKFDIVDDNNIDSYVAKGVESVPAMVIHTDVVHGVNTILSDLAKLEMIKADVSVASKVSKEEFSSKPSMKRKTENFQDMAWKEMLSGEQEDENGSSMTVRNQSVEAPLDDKTIESRTAVYDAMMNERKSRMDKANKHRPKSAMSIATKPNNLMKLAADPSLDKGEAMLMRQMIADDDSDGDY
jgi:hypothetical protein